MFFLQSFGDRQVCKKEQRINTCMRYFEIAPTAPKTPDQLRVDSLKAAKDRANDALKAERKRQTVVKAQQKLAAVQTAKPIKPH